MEALTVPCQILQVQALKAVPDIPARVALRRRLAVKDFQDRQGQGLLFHFPRIGGDWGDEAAAGAQAIDNVGVADQATGEENGVHLAAEDGAHAADELGDLVDQKNLLFIKNFLQGTGDFCAFL